MNQYKIILVFAITGGLIGLILALQFKSGVPKESSYPLDQLEIQKGILQSYAEDQQKLEVELKNLRDSLQESQQKLEKGTSQSAKQTLSRLKTLAGASETTGKGIEIFLADSVYVTRETVNPQDDSLVHPSDIRDIVNLLFASEASAVSINGRRISPLSSINVVGNTFFINDFYGFPPFTITAIGSPEVLLSRLRDESLLSDIHKRMRGKKIRFVFQERKELSVPAFSGVYRTQFIKPAL